MSCRALLLACAVLVATGGPARAASPREQAKAEVEKAEVHYKLGRFQEALDAYARAYELVPAPVLLFDIGQCHKHLKNHDRAIYFFEGYLREETNPARRRLAEDLITELKGAREREAQEKQRQAAAAPPSETTPPPPVAPPPALAPPPPAAETAPALVASPPPETPAGAPLPVTRKWWFWAVVGGAALAVAAGSLAYYESGSTTTVLPGGSVGTLDRR